MKSRDLIDTARALAALGKGRPTQANLRRAHSTAYYAVFHSLARTATELLIGSHSCPGWHRAYRALEHGSAKNACRNKDAMQGFPPALQDFADTFVTLQAERHQADYALEGRYYKQRTLAAIERAENAISGLESAEKQDLRGFVAHVLFKPRPS